MAKRGVCTLGATEPDCRPLSRVVVRCSSSARGHGRQLGVCACVAACAAVVDVLVVLDPRKTGHCFEARGIGSVLVVLGVLGLNRRIEVLKDPSHRLSSSGSVWAARWTGHTGHTEHNPHRCRTTCVLGLNRTESTEDTGPRTEVAHRTPPSRWPQASPPCRGGPRTRHACRRAAGTRFRQHACWRCGCGSACSPSSS